MKHTLYRVLTNNACFGIVVDERGVVVEVAPIAHRCLGREFVDVLSSYAARHWRVQRLSDSEA